MSEHVCFTNGQRLWSGAIIHERGDDLFVDVRRPGGPYSPDRVFPALIKVSAVVGRGDKYAMQDAASLGNALLKPQPGIEAAVALARKKISEGRPD